MTLSRMTLPILARALCIVGASVVCVGPGCADAPPPDAEYPSNNGGPPAQLVRDPTAAEAEQSREVAQAAATDPSAAQLPAAGEPRDVTIGVDPQAGGDQATADDSPDDDPRAIDEFRPVLEPYGTWQDDPNYGTVWVPSRETVGDDFTPYSTSGHWTYDDTNDYVWASDYAWGWGPFHYGRWVYLPGGWGWIPGSRYAGAWVAWRAGDPGFGYVGWAPLAAALVLAWRCCRELGGATLRAVCILPGWEAVRAEIGGLSRSWPRGCTHRKPNAAVRVCQCAFRRAWRLCRPPPAIAWHSGEPNRGAPRRNAPSVPSGGQSRGDGERQLRVRCWPAIGGVRSAGIDACPLEQLFANPAVVAGLPFVPVVSRFCTERRALGIRGPLWWWRSPSLTSGITVTRTAFVVDFDGPRSTETVYNTDYGIDRQGS